MSIRLMSQVWGLKLPDSEMLILLALADWSNDDGGCWPSIAQLRAKTNKSERTIQGAIKSLVEAGHMSRDEVPGKGCKYRIHPRSDCAPAATAPRKRSTPAKAAPPQPLPETPAAAADNTLEYINPQKTSSSSDSARDEQISVDEFVEGWRALAEDTGIPTIRGKLGAKRLKAFKARVREYPADDFVAAFARIRGSPFLRGEVGNWSGANVDFFLRPESINKILEGAYDRAAH